MSPRNPLLATALVLGALVAGIANARSEGKVALVIAAEDYQKLPKSALGAKRGGDLSDALKARGFDVTLAANPTSAATRVSLRDFAAKAAGADVALALILGHGTSWSGQSFFLSTNSEITRATDLLSRGLSIATVAQIVKRASVGGVFFLMTTPSFEVPIEDLDARPHLAGDIGGNVVVVFSSSARVPVSRVDAISERAADELAKVLRQPDSMLTEAVKAVAGGDIGLVIGAPANVSLSKVSRVAPATVAPAPAPPAPVQADAARGTETTGAASTPGPDRQAGEAGEERAKAEQAQAEVLKAQADARKAQADAERARADAAKAIAEAERAKLEAKRMELGQAMAKATPPTIDEPPLGVQQRQRIQQRLKDMGLYTGKIDSVMGPLTREAIMGYQKSRGTAVTGYLTADQFEALLEERK